MAPAPDTSGSTPWAGAQSDAMPAFWLAWCAFILFALYAGLLPFHFGDAASAMAKLHELPLTVMDPRHGRLPSAPDMLQNVILFLPFGVLGMTVLRARCGLIWSLLLVIVAGAATSLAIEALQLFTLDRVSSLNDVATNLTGTLLGALLTPPLLFAGRRVLQLFSAAGLLVPSLYPVLVGLLVLVVAAWHPFDPTLDVGSVWSKWWQFTSNPWQFGELGDEGVDAVRYALFAAATVIWLREVQVLRAWWLVATLGSLLPCAFEMSQLVFESRVPGVKDMVVGIAGIWIGAGLASVARDWPVKVNVAVVVVSAWLAAMVLVLAPFEIAAERRPFEWEPFLSYYQYTSGRTISHTVELQLAFFPVGFACASVMASRTRWFWLLLVSLLLAVPLEYMQGWIIGRYDDVTDVGMLMLGAAAGMWVARRCGFPH